ncbi:hypothetical protein [Tateyamaria sp.]|uniref:hypothetical protein n=1 Tax=Tateyamaria sp. TaxID=1929288 RepID=UPI003B21C068
MVLFVLMPNSLWALGLNCIFDIECFESEGCDMSAYGMDIWVDYDTAPYPVTAETDAETLSGEAFDFGDGLLMRLGSEVGAVLISVDGDGIARQSVHMSGGAMMVNYMGACGVMD